MKLRNWLVLGFLSASVMGFSAAALGGEAKKHEAFLTVESAGPAYALQGEYVATGKVGIQVIALGNDQFRAVFFPGGLPGAGYKTGKAEVEGKLEEGKVAFKGNGYEATLAAGKINGQSTDGAFSAQKINRQSPTLGAPRPANAVVLFDGTDVKGWKSGAMDANKNLKAGTVTLAEFKDFTLHVEFFLPFMPTARGQSRSNSGVYLQGRYEVQVLDSFGLKGADNECGGVYKNAAPAVNMCLPPLVWQTYDIDFTAARFENGQKTKNAIVTIRHNGVVIHDKLELKGPTPGGPKSGNEQGDGPISLQHHGNPVVFRNIWIVEKK